MEAADLQGKFRLGECLVEPRDRRITGPSGPVVLDPAQLALLLCLVRHHGEVVPSAQLRQCAWPQSGGTDHDLRAGIHALRQALGGSPADRRYIVSIGHGDFALVAHFEPPDEPDPYPIPIAPALGDEIAPETPTSFGGHLQKFIVELRRRSVLKVTGAYLVGMWIVLQVAETTFEPLRLPEWWLPALAILTVLGLPIVAALAWSYEITATGIVLDSGAPGGMKLPRARRAIAPVIVAGVALMAAVTGVAWWRSIDVPDLAAAAPPEPGQPSVAVLPLVDMSPAGGNAYLGDGLSEELSARLAQIPGLRVAARTSAFEFKDRNVDVRRIGESLGVRHVLEGSVRRAGDNLRVTMQLIDAVTGYHVWSGSYDRSWSDVIAIQDDIAHSVTDALRVVLVPDARAKPGTETVADVRAFDPYLAGLAMLRQSGDMSRLREAVRHFEEAVEIEPAFTRAHAGLCTASVRIYDRTRDPADLARAEESCQRALNLDPTLVETEKALGSLYLASGRPGRAETIFRGLATRSPKDADGHIGLGRALAAEGQFEAAEASFRAAVQAEPAYWGAFNALGGFLMERGEMAEAVLAFREVTELAPSSASAYNNYGAALLMSGDLEGASDAYQRSLKIEPSLSAYSNLGTVHYMLHEFEVAVADYERATALAGQNQMLWGNLADALWQIPGRREEAVARYRRAIALAERELAADAGDSTLLAQLGYYYGRVGDAESSRRYLLQAESGPADPYLVYYLAVAAADRGDLAAAREYATAAAKLGYPETLLRADPSLARLSWPKQGST